LFTTKTDNNSNHQPIFVSLLATTPHFALTLL